MKSTRFRVGDLAERTGVSVRTLRYYDEIGLLVPSTRTRSGHRLYGADDVVRLQQILSMRAIGLALDEIREFLETPGYSPVRVLEGHLARAREELGVQQQLVDRLERLLQTLRRGGAIDTEEILKTIEVMTMWEKTLTTEQTAEVKERGAQLGAEKIHEVEEEWKRIIAAMRSEMEAGTDPKDERVQALTRRSRELVKMFSGGNQAIEGTLREAYRGGAGAAFGLDAALTSYWERAAR